jgi:outer membrane usher protein
MPVGARASARATYDSRGRRGSLEYSRFQPDEIDTFGVRGAIGRADEGYNVAGELSYNANRFGAVIEHSLITDTAGALRTQETALSMHTQFALAGDRLAFGRPVGPRFAIVSAHSSLDESHVNVRQGPGRLKPQARSDALGPALAPAGNSYTASELRLDADNLPAGYDLGEAQYVVKPAPAAGYKITIGSDASRVIIGTAVGDDGAPISLQGGTLRLLGDAKFAPVLVFTNRAGRFAGNGLKPGHYALTLGDDDQFHATVDVPAKANGVVMLGSVRVKEEKR